MSNLRLTFKKNLAIYIKAAGITQVELAERIGVGKNNITNWLNGKSIPDLDIINNICVALGVSMPIMLGIDVLKDAKKEQLIKNFELLNEKGQDDLLDYSEFLIGKPKNLKNKAPPDGKEKTVNE